MTPDPKPKTIRLNKKEYAKFRISLANRARSHCETCGKWAPPMKDGVFDVFECGHVSHLKSRGAGGSDTPENCLYECYTCHQERDNPLHWSKKL